MRSCHVSSIGTMDISVPVVHIGLVEARGCTASRRCCRGRDVEPKQAGLAVMHGAGPRRTTKTCVGRHGPLEPANELEVQ